MTTPFAEFADSPEALVVVFLWAVLEATVLPVVPDVLMGLLLLASPWRIVPLLASAVAGGLLGGLGWWRTLHARPEAAQRILLAQPGLGSAGLREAEERIDRLGPARGFAQVGPGLPLKAYLAALATREPDASAGRVAGLIVLNRLTRLGPVALGFALAAPLAAMLDGPPVVLGTVYFAGWTAFYVVYWVRRSRSAPPG